MASQSYSTAPSRSLSTTPMANTVKVGQLGNGQVTSHKGGPDHQSKPGNDVKGFTANVINPFVK